MAIEITSFQVNLFSEDIDTAYAAALAAGGTPVHEPEDYQGGRGAPRLAHRPGRPPRRPGRDAPAVTHVRATTRHDVLRPEAI